MASEAELDAMFRNRDGTLSLKEYQGGLALANMSCGQRQSAFLVSYTQGALFKGY